jgi:hypothetical protein
MALGDNDVPSVPYDDLFSLAYRFKCPGEHSMADTDEPVVVRGRCPSMRFLKLKPRFHINKCFFNKGVDASTLQSSKVCGIRSHTRSMPFRGLRRLRGCPVYPTLQEFTGQPLRCGAKLGISRKFLKATGIRCKIKHTDLVPVVSSHRLRCTSGGPSLSGIIRARPILPHCRTWPAAQTYPAQYSCHSITGAWSYNLEFGSTKFSLSCAVTEPVVLTFGGRLCNQHVHTSNLPSDQTYGGAIATNIIALNCRTYPLIELLGAHKICTTVRLITPLVGRYGNSFRYTHPGRPACKVSTAEANPLFVRARCGTRIQGVAPLLVFGRVLGGQQLKFFPVETGRVFGDIAIRPNYYIGTRPPPPPPAAPTPTSPGPTSPPTG